MQTIPIFAAEREAGLEGKIKASLKASYLTGLQVVKPTQADFDRVSTLVKANARTQEDLHWLQTILVTTGWNKNTDVFLPYEVWAARKTPEDKPFNYEHDFADIIGHITEVSPVDSEYKTIAEDSVLDDLPAKFHLLTGAVLYTNWEDHPDKQDRMDSILAEIPDGLWYVSMEALFKGFDYALLADDGSQQIVARNDDTAFLTKHLRAYGGDGTYDGQLIGRIVRNIVFSGKGLVRKPANPESVIFAHEKDFSEKTSTFFGQNNFEINKLGYDSSDGRKSVTQTMESKTMATENTDKLIADLRKQNEALQARLDQISEEAVKAQIDAAKAEADKAKADLAKAQEDLVKAAEENKSLATQIEEANAANEKAKADLTAANEKATALEEQFAKIEKEKVTIARVAKVKEDLGLEEEAAVAFVENLDSFSDEQFDRQVEATVKIQAASKPKPPVKKKKSGDAEEDEAEANADESALETAEAKQEPTLTTPESNASDVEKLRADVATYFVRDGDRDESDN